MATKLPGASVSAVILAFRRKSALQQVLARLESESVDEILIVDNSGGEAVEAVDLPPKARVILPEGGNVGIAARNIAARAATSYFLLMLDDDSYPLEGAVEALLSAFAAHPRLGVVGGLVRDVDVEGNVIRLDEVGTFDWFLRAGYRGPVPSDGVPTFFFPEGGCLIRRDAFLEVGGFFEPYFFTVSEVDVATRMIGAGWDVRYVPSGAFDHMKDPAGRAGGRQVLKHRVRNQIWYFWRHFPWSMVVRRVPAYLVFDLIESTYRGGFSAWLQGLAEAWRERNLVLGTRCPLPRAALRRAEMNRGRIHVALLWRQLLRRLRR